MERNPNFLESSVLLNETQYSEGYNNSYNDDLLSGEEEGREVGMKVGFRVCKEQGFYHGCVDIWKLVVRFDSRAFSSSIQKTIDQLSELLNKYPILEPKNEGIQEMMDAIRLKFRLISMHLGVKLEYQGYLKSSKQEFEDI